MASDLSSLRTRAERAASSLPALRVRAERAAATALAGQHRQRRQGPGERFWQFRDYATFDRPRDIDWRRSGKGDRVFVRQKELQTAQTTYIWLQADAGMAYRSAPGLPAKRDDGATLAYALGLLATRDEERVAHLGAAYRPARGEAALETLGDALLRRRDDGVLRVDQPLPAHAAIVLVGDFLAPLDRLEAAFHAFAVARAGGVLIQALDPAELALPFSGRAIFAPPDAGPDYPVMDVDAVRAAYRDRIKAHNDALRALCRAQGWTYLLHRSGQDCGATLARLWTDGPL